MDIGVILEGVELMDMAVTALAGSAAVSEALPMVKKIKANSAWQLVWNAGKVIVGMIRKK